ncbi:MAG: SWIM zinc finger family protein, partial [Planctomycetota bacterium]
MIAPKKDNDDQPADHTDVELSYAGQSQLLSEGDSSRLALFGNLQRDPVFLDGTVKDPLRLREAMGAMYAVVGSDYRYVPKDRTAYNAYRRMRNQSANLNAWQAQQAYFAWLMRNDPLAYLILDPVITVHPDCVFMEVFSKDEGSYANLTVDMSAFELEGDPVCGTTNIDFSQTLYDSVQQFRSYRTTRLTVGQEAVKVATTGQAEVLEKQIRVPDSWMRGFLQVQSSTLLPMDSFRLTAMDLYNILRHLRMNGDRKGKRRGLRFELVPGEMPRVVLEPWETVIETGAEIYQGRQAKVIRVWGRRRLMLLRRLLPF